jgi:hypothetical protein
MSGIFLSLSSIKHSFSALLVLFRFSSNIKKKEEKSSAKKKNKEGKKRTFVRVTNRKRMQTASS